MCEVIYELLNMIVPTCRSEPSSPPREATSSVSILLHKTAEKEIKIALKQMLERMSPGRILLTSYS